jgi:hypothetical protein
MTRLKRYFWYLLVAVDQLLNVLVGGFPDETFSARTWRKAEAGQWFWQALRRLIDGFFRLIFKQDDHCQKSYENEAVRGHSPQEFANE